MRLKKFYCNDYPKNIAELYTAPPIVSIQNEVVYGKCFVRTQNPPSMRPRMGVGYGSPQPMYSGCTSVERYSGCTTVDDGSNGRSVSIFPRFLSTLPDVFTRLLEKCAKFYLGIF